MLKPSAHHPLYVPLDFAVVRAPLLSIEAYLSLRSEADQLKLLEDMRAQRAIAAASPSLLSALGRWKRGALTKRDADRLAAKLLMYQIRMSTRPTPFGLFAGCSTVEWAEHTDLSIRATFGHSHTRPDLSWLLGLVMEAEAIPEVRRQLCYVSNPLIRFQGDRAILTESTPPDTKNVPVSVRATTVVKRALQLAGDGIRAVDLAEQLTACAASSTPEKIEGLLRQLWEQGLLLTDLRPPLTTASPADYVQEKLAKIPEAADVMNRLNLLVTAATAWDRASHDDSLDAFRLLLQAADCPEDGSKELPLQVDMALCVTGRAGRSIGQQAALAAELLLRLSPMPRGLSSLAAYRSAFVARYGLEREVPLPELMDTVAGLGPLAAYGGASVGPNFDKAAMRSSELLRLACLALNRREKVALLDDTSLGRLETWMPEDSSAPLSLDLNVLIAAKAMTAIDAGEFTLVVGPNLGAWGAGRTFGRFAHLHPSGRDCLQQAASKEKAATGTDHLWAEVVYLPRKIRSANVAVRPALRRYEVVFGVSPGVARELVIHPEELVVGVDNNRFYVRWLPGGQRVKFASGHMLNHMGAPAMAQFLLQVGHDGETPLISFDWGPAEGFPFLPRAQVGRIVLRPAEWRILKSSGVKPNAEALTEWRTEWDVPRFVCLTFGDNRLVLDLDLATHIQILIAEWKRLSDHQSLTLQEVLPSLDEAWLTGEEGSYYSEITVPLLLQTSAPIKNPSTSKHLSTLAPVSAPRREYQPGSEWLYVKLYGPLDRQDELIGQFLQPFARNAMAAGFADSWFFIRYADPEDHVRLRFHGDPGQLCDRLFGQLCRWAADLVDRGMCRRFAFDAYDSEIERFGGVEGLSSSESIFCADSDAASELTTILAAEEWQDLHRRTLLLALSVHDLMDAFGFCGSEALDWYKKFSGDGKRLTEYRQFKDDLRFMISRPADWLATQPQGEQIADVLSLRRQRLGSLLIGLRGLADRSMLLQPLDALCCSYVHLHLNRLGAAVSERLVLNLLLRTCESLSKAPAKS